MRARVVILAALCFVGVPFSDGVCQTPERVVGELTLLSHDARLRIASQDMRLEGRLFALEPDSLRLLRDGIVTNIAYGRIDSLWVRQSAMKPGAVIGGVVGGVIGAGLMAAVVNGLCAEADGCAEAYPGAVLVGVVSFGGTGALAGAGLGLLLQRWDRRLP